MDLGIVSNVALQSGIPDLATQTNLLNQYDDRIIARVNQITYWNDKSDCYQIARLAFLEACQKHNPKYGSLWTFAGLIINQRVRNFMYHYSTSITCPWGKTVETKLLQDIFGTEDNEKKEAEKVMAIKNLIDTMKVRTCLIKNRYQRQKALEYLSGKDINNRHLRIRVRKAILAVCEDLRLDYLLLL